MFLKIKYILKTKQNKKLNEIHMKNEDYVAYCGIYCKLCSNHQTIPKRANDLKNILLQSEFEDWGVQYKEFNDFWTFHTIEDVRVIRELPEILKYL